MLLNKYALCDSLAITNVFDYLFERQHVQMQGLSRRFYHRIIPQYLSQVRLGASTVKRLFSYEVEEQSLWTFHTQEVAWHKRALNKQNSPFKLLNHAQIAVATTINKVFILGGSSDRKCNEVSNQNLEWCTKTDTIRQRS